jgi:prepilin-type N-terminal cleavage/methylation domain-containing protein
LRSQEGFTLVELLVASAIGVIVMTGLTSVVLTSWRAGSIATGRILASSQIRNFEFAAQDDFALSALPTPSGCAATIGSPCTTQVIALQGSRASNAAPPSINPYSVSYTWDGTGLVFRQVGANSPVEAATNVSAFSWYIDGSSQTVVVTMSVTVQSYTQTQTFRFHTEVNP